MLIVYVSTVVKLGVTNIVRVLVHRACKVLGVYKWFLPSNAGAFIKFEHEWPSVVEVESAPSQDQSVKREADYLIAGRISCFSSHLRSLGNPPSWFLTEVEDKPHPHTSEYWSDIRDFDSSVGDIKVIWEPSRFTWATVLARAWRLTGDWRYLSTLLRWIEDWCEKNPPYVGPNWMCGQEASLRLINSLLAFRIAGVEKQESAGLASFVEVHCRRIDLTSTYAVAQDNNHATSEAAGLFMGGEWLVRSADEFLKSGGARWMRRGRNLLERAVSRLILPDGSFSQHSLTYHRMMLDTLSLVEISRRNTNERPFTDRFYERAAAATRWLAAMIDPIIGDGPNLGHNDGCNPFRLDSTSYRDFRSSLQLGARVFFDRPAIGSGRWDESATWLNLPIKSGLSPLPWQIDSYRFSNGGYVVIRNRKGVGVIIRTPTARFRPTHADALHIDLWWRGKNLFRDGGTYTYADDPLNSELCGVRGHNVPQFDGHDQMPRLGRFLFGNWSRVKELKPLTSAGDTQSWSGQFIDAWGSRHQRTVTVTGSSLYVVDRVDGFKTHTVLRWRLAPDPWVKTDRGCYSKDANIEIDCNVPVRRIEITQGWESQGYLQKSELPVLEVEVDQSPAVLTTKVDFS